MFPQRGQRGKLSERIKGAPTALFIDVSVTNTVIEGSDANRACRMIQASLLA